jgi:glycosyltransferase involved in cell wall biosynthesis
MPIKIYLADNSLYKTTKILKRAWEEDPQIELKCDPYWNPLKAEWADVIWVEWTEGAIQQASLRKQFYPGVVSDHKQQPDREYDWSGALIINRIIDIDAYYGHYRQVKWENVNCLAYIAKHIFNMVDTEMKFAEKYPTLNTIHIPLSIDLSEWSYRKHEHGHNIAWINHNWTGKGLPLMLQALHQLKKITKDDKWKLHIVCDWSNEHWYPPYIYHIIKALGLEDNVIFYPKVNSVNEFLDSMDYLVSSSYKEAFSLILAEAMAKGIKALTHNWVGANDIWPSDIIWTDIDEFVNKLLGEYNSEYYRSLAEKYDKKNEIEAAKTLFATKYG